MGYRDLQNPRNKISDTFSALRLSSQEIPSKLNSPKYRITPTLTSFSDNGIMDLQG